MLKKTLLATAAAAAIAGGTLAISATGASAAPYDGGYGGGYGGYPQHQVCTPVTRTVHWTDRWGHRHAYVKVVGQECHPAPIPPYHPPMHFPHHSGGWGW